MCLMFEGLIFCFIFFQLKWRHYSNDLRWWARWFRCWKTKRSYENPSWNGWNRNVEVIWWRQVKIRQCRKIHFTIGRCTKVSNNTHSSKPPKMPLFRYVYNDDNHKYFFKSFWQNHPKMWCRQCSQLLQICVLFLRNHWVISFNVTLSCLWKVAIAVLYLFEGKTTAALRLWLTLSKTFEKVITIDVILNKPK